MSNQRTVKQLEILRGMNLRATLSKVRVRQVHYCGRGINPTTTIFMLEGVKETPQYFKSQKDAHAQFLVEDKWAGQKAVAATA